MRKLSRAFDPVKARAGMTPAQEGAEVVQALPHQEIVEAIVASRDSTTKPETFERVLDFIMQLGLEHAITFPVGDVEAIVFKIASMVFQELVAETVAETKENVGFVSVPLQIAQVIASFDGGAITGGDDPTGKSSSELMEDFRAIVAMVLE